VVNKIIFVRIAVMVEGAEVCLEDALGIYLRSVSYSYDVSGSWFVSPLLDLTPLI
jgi:hypothetical protein